MDKQQFRESLHLGLGRALLYARDHNVNEFRDVILDACLHCYSYDIQLDGTRADYMYELVDLLPYRKFYRETVLNSLAGTLDDPDAVRRFRFVTCMAAEEDENAKRVMYDSYNPGPRYGESIGLNFLDLDGIQGLLFVAEKMGALLLTKTDAVDIGWVVSHSIDVFGGPETWEALRNAAHESPQIEAFRQRCEASQKRLTDPVRAELPNIPYAELFDRIPANKPYLLWKWGEQASDQELDLAAHGLIAARDSDEQVRHLRIFTRRRFPLPPNALLALATVEKKRVGFFAVQALAHIADPAVRDLAFRLVNSNVSWRGASIALLSKNFESGDHEIVLDWFEAEKEPETRHSFGMDLRDFWEQHPDETTEVRMQELMYERTPCSHCREIAVRRLIELGALTEAMRAECAYDANSDIRDLVC